MDLKEKFLNLSARTGATFRILEKDSTHLNTFLSTFLCGCAKPCAPTRKEAQAFLEGPASWTRITPEELLERTETISLETDLGALDFQELKKSVEEYKKAFRDEKKAQARKFCQASKSEKIDTACDEEFMKEALCEARLAAEQGEVPVGAVVVSPEGQIIGRGHNRVIALHDPSAHAEMTAIREAAKNIENYRLEDCTIYVTLEPCPMCSGAIMGSRMMRLVYGAKEEKTGAVESVCSLFSEPKLNAHTLVRSGVLASEAKDILQKFFLNLRTKSGSGK